MCLYLKFEGLLELKGLFFAKISSEDEMEWLSTRIVDVEEGIKLALKKIATRLIEKDSSRRSYGGVFRENMAPWENISRELFRLRTIRLPEDYDVFEDTAVAITLKYADSIDSRSNIGSLFIAVLSQGNHNIIAMISMDQMISNHFELDSVNKILSKRPSQSMLLDRTHFQKGTIYPHPFISAFDMKVIEKNTSVYYKDLLCITRVYELGPFLDLLEDASNTVRGHTLKIGEITKLFQLLRAAAAKGDTILKGNNLDAVITKFVLDDNGERIKNHLKAEGVNSVLVNRDMLGSIDLRIELDMGVLEGKADDLLTSMIHRGYPGGQVISVASNDVETDMED